MEQTCPHPSHPLLAPCMGANRSCLLDGHFTVSRPLIVYTVHPTRSWCTDVSNEVAHLQNQFFLLNHVTYLFSNGHDEPGYPGLAQVRLARVSTWQPQPWPPLCLRALQMPASKHQDPGILKGGLGDGAAFSQKSHLQPEHQPAVHVLHVCVRVPLQSSFVPKKLQQRPGCSRRVISVVEVQHHPGQALALVNPIKGHPVSRREHLAGRREQRLSTHYDPICAR